MPWWHKAFKKFKEKKIQNVCSSDELHCVQNVVKPTKRNNKKIGLNRIYVHTIDGDLPKIVTYPLN